MKIFLATNNGGKIERFKKLLKLVDKDIKVFTPQDLNIAVLEVIENGKTLEENARLKASAYSGKVDMPILANDTGFYVEGDGFVDAPKRTALEGINKNTLSKEEISHRILNFWKGVATRHGGKVDAAWVEAFVALYPTGEIKKAESRRETVLTDEEFGISHLEFPVRALYYSKTTNKPSIQHSEEEEILEMKPVIDALATVLGLKSS